MQFVGDSTLGSAYRDFGEDADIAIIVPEDSEPEWNSDVETPSITPYPTTSYTLPSPHTPYHITTLGVSEAESYRALKTSPGVNYDDIIEPELERLHLRDSSPDDLGFVDYVDEDLEPTPAPKQRILKRKELSHKDICKSCKPRPARPNVLLTPRDFHNCKNYIPARYSVKLQKQNSQIERSKIKIPNSLCPSTRYGREARIISCRASFNPHKQWQTPAVHPPSIKKKDQASMCEILKIVDTVDACEQIKPDTTQSSVQCQAPTSHSSTQYSKIRRCHVGIQAPGVKHTSVGVQNTSTMCSTMTETDLTLLYYPPVPYGHQANYTVQTTDNTYGTLRVTLKDDEKH